MAPRHGRIEPRPALTLAFTLAGALLAGPARAVDIGLLHCNDGNGRPLAPYNIGAAVTVSGVVTVGTGTFTATYTDLWIQDPTGGMEIYNAAIPATFAPGDSVTFSGTIDQYRGNTEVKMTSWTVHGAGYSEPAPLVLTCYDADHSYLPNNCEPHEGLLVRLNGVSLAGPWPTAGGAVTLSDASGTATLYIDTDTGLQNITPPGGNFDVIGILKQFSGFSPPFNTGYEVIPRSAADLIALPGPQIVTGPEEGNLQPNQVTISWTTDVPSTAEVDYGETAAYELGTAVGPNGQTDHAITLPALDPATIHHFRVRSANQYGQVQTGDRLFSTASRPECTGEVRVYFNKTVDPSLSLGHPAEGSVDLAAKLVERINAAQHSIDICLYSFDLQGVADALIAAHDRGVEVRFVYDNRTTYQAQVTRLIQNGITVIDDAYGPVNTGSELMHNKFWVFDHRAGDTDATNDWLVTGSHNLTATGTYTDAQNSIYVQDEALCETYTAEMNEMWGSATITPNPNTSRFGVHKLDDTPKRFNVAGVPMRAYFSPSDGVISQIISEVNAADATLHFCILSYTRDDLALAMQTKFYGVPGFEVRGVFDSAQGSDPASEYQNMKGIGTSPWSPPADVWLDAQAGDLHHKYMIIDANKSWASPTVITGSANWSTAGTSDNDENILVVQDFGVANQYFQEFAERYHLAGGTGYLAANAEPALASRAASLSVFPNPARGAATVRYSLPGPAVGRLALYDAAGRRERVLHHGRFEAAGALGVDFLGADFGPLPRGVHFLRLEAEGRSVGTPVLILR